MHDTLLFDMNVRGYTSSRIDTNIAIKLVTVTKEQYQLLNAIMLSSFKWAMNMRVCCKDHYCDGVSDRSAFLEVKH